MLSRRIFYFITETTKLFLIESRTKADHLLTFNIKFNINITRPHLFF